MLTIINAQNGEVRYEDIKSLAPGQVLVQNCDKEDVAILEDLFKNDIISGQSLSPTLNREFCCPVEGRRCSSKHKVSKQEIAEAKADIQKFKKSVEDSKVNNVKTYKQVLAKPKFIEELRVAVAEDKNCNPNSSMITTKNIKTMLLVYYLVGPKETFRLSDIKVELNKFGLFEGNLSHLANDLNLLIKTNNITYVISNSFYDVLWDVVTYHGDIENILPIHIA